MLRAADRAFAMLRAADRAFVRVKGEGPLEGPSAALRDAPERLGRLRTV
jgi:hypothetical protein